MAEENDLFDDDEIEDEEETPAEEEAGEDEVPELDDEEEDPEASNASLLDVLGKLGIHLPEDVDLSDAEDFKSALYIAAHAVVMHKEQNGDSTVAPEDEEASLLDDPDAAPVEEPAMGAMLSHANGTTVTHNRLPAPKKKPKVQLSQDAVQLSQQLTETQQELAKQRLTGIGLFDLIGRLLKTGRCTAARAKEWKSVLSARQLSLAVGDDSEVNHVLSQIELAKDLPKNAVVKMSTLTAPSGGEPPAPDYVDKSGSYAKTTKNLIEHISGKKQHKF